MPSDTTKAARQAQIAAYQRMTPAARVALAVKMSEDARRITEAGIRARNPELSDDEVRKALFRTILGDELYDQAGFDER